MEKGNKIITIGREFGSGGRELGKRIAENLGIAYYDGEIITAIAKRSELAVSYVDQVLEKRIHAYYPITIANSFAAHQGDAVGAVTRSIYTAQTEIIREMAEKSDCVIVGRCADHILAEYKPLRLFVYADLPSKMTRCREKHGEEGLTDRELEKRIRQVDRDRAQYYRFYTGLTWGDRNNYDLCVNTTGLRLADVARLIAGMERSE